MAIASISYNNLCYTYPDGHEALRDVCFEIGQGEKVALTGDNGTGKSTLLLQTVGLLLPASGLVTVGGLPVCKANLREVRRRVGLVFQNPDDQLFMPTVADDVAFGPLNMGLPHAEVCRRVDEALAAVGAWHLRHRHPYTLSVGQKRSVAIATVLSMHPDIILMDEPTSNLDNTSVARLVSFIKTINHTCLIATHNMAFAADVCSREWHLERLPVP